MDRGLVLDPLDPVGERDRGSAPLAGAPDRVECAARPRVGGEGRGIQDTLESDTQGSYAPRAREEDTSGAAPGTVAPDPIRLVTAWRSEWSANGHLTEQRPNSVEQASSRALALLDKREFLVDVAHELRTPVATIRASTEVLVDALAPSLSDGLLLLLHNLEHEADRLASLVDNLLDLNTLRAERGCLHRVRSDLRDLARATVLSIVPLARRRDQIVSLDLPPAPVWAVVDARLLERALLNLVSNAHKYGADAGRISVRLDADATSACFAVADDGPGIPAEDRERIFERLYRGADAQARRIQGSGLGLALCRAVVELHGGRVGVADGSTGGSVFTIELPLGL